MKQTFQLIMTFLFINVCRSQNASLITNGADLIISSNTTITGLNNITINGTTDYILNNGNCYLIGSFINYGNGLNTSGTGTVIFNGTSTQNINGSNSTTFYDIGKSNINSLVLGLNTTIANNVTLMQGILDLNDKTLKIGGKISGTSAGTISGSSLSALIVYNNVDHGLVYFTHNRPFNLLKKLALNAGTLSFGGSVTTGDTLNIIGGDVSTGYGNVNVDGTLNTNGMLTLLSDAFGTAQVGQSAGTITGDVTVQRYFPAIRAWRFVAVPFSSSGTKTINDEWQEGNVHATLSCPPPLSTQGTQGYGTEITYNNINGYDVHNNNYKTSIQTYQNNAWQTPTGTYENFVDEPSSLNPALPGYPAYALFLRGDRSVCLTYEAPAIPTTLRAKGVLNQSGGTVNHSFPTGSPGDYILIGNPYASTIHLDDVIFNRSAGINKNNFWTYNPNAGTTGGYVTFSLSATMNVPYTGPITAYIQSGQGFMVQRDNSATAPSLNFQESDKSSDQTQTTANIFGLQAAPNSQTRSVVYTNLTDTTGAIIDGVAGVFGNQYLPAVDEVDANKKWNEEIENMAIIRHDTALAIEFRPLPESTDTLFFRLYLRQQAYKLKVFTQNLSPRFLSKAWIVDKYLNTETEINLQDTSLYSFTPNTDTNSYRNRFMIVFTPSKGERPAKLDSLISKLKTHIFPNPASGRVFNLVMEGGRNDKYTVNIFNTSATIVLTRSIAYQTGKISYLIPLSANLTSGSYTVQILNSSGVIVTALPLVIAR